MDQRGAAVATLLIVLIVVLALLAAACARAFALHRAITAGTYRGGAGRKRAGPPSVEEITRALSPGLAGLRSAGECVLAKKDSRARRLANATKKRKEIAKRFKSPRLQARVAKEDVVIDTLNLTHHLINSQDKGSSFSPRHEGVTRDSITETIIFGSARISDVFPGRRVFVLKDRDSVPNDKASREQFQKLAEEHNVHIHVVERSATDRGGKGKAAWQPSGEVDDTHQSLGRDDFYMGYLAWKMECAVITEDRMRDFDKLKTEVPPFAVYKITPSETVRDHVNPGAPEYHRLRAPPQVRHREVGL